jgi:hypothetical protein
VQRTQLRADGRELLGRLVGEIGNHAIDAQERKLTSQTSEQGGSESRVCHYFVILSREMETDNSPK